MTHAIARQQGRFARRVLRLRPFTVRVLRAQPGPAATVYRRVGGLTLQAQAARAAAELAAEVAAVAGAPDRFSFGHEPELADLVAAYRAGGGGAPRHGDLIVVEDTQGERTGWTWTSGGVRAVTR